jgi:transcriptional regulator with XRE-family HTH domain
MMTQEPRTWRQYLGKLLEHPAEKRRMAEALGVSERTLDRWATGISSPRSLAPLRQLLQVLPTHRAALTDLLQQEFPLETVLAEEEEEFLLDDVFKHIPPLFYTRILETYATSVEPMRSWSICNMVLQQLTKHLDSDHVGVSALLVRCLPPAPGQKVQSLFVQYSWGTAPAQLLPGESGRYYGAESLAGKVVATGLPAVIPDGNDTGYPFSLLQDQGMHSAAAYPIQCTGRLAGCVLVLGKQSHFFTPTRLKLIQHYSYLLALAFREHDFYAPQEIALRMMPSETAQRSLLMTMNERINALLSQAEHHGEPLTRSQAEQMVFQQLETALLHLAEQEEDDRVVNPGERTRG